MICKSLIFTLFPLDTAENLLGINCPLTIFEKLFVFGVTGTISFFFFFTPFTFAFFESSVLLRDFFIVGDPSVSRGKTLPSFDFSLLSSEPFLSASDVLSSPVFPVSFCGFSFWFKEESLFSTICFLSFSFSCPCRSSANAKFPGTEIKDIITASDINLEIFFTLSSCFDIAYRQNKPDKLKLVRFI